jgi:hypothetical protein
VRRCLFENNTAYGNGESGGGIALGAPSQAIIEDCTFLDNRVSAQDGPAVSFGGAISCGDQTEIRNCVFQANDAEIGSCVYATGTVSISECTFDGNEGGAVHAAGGSITVETCTFVGNTADEGAGVSVTAGTLTVSDSRFTGNLGKYSTVHADGAAVVLVRCTIADNDVTTAGGISGIKGTSATVDVEQCIVLNECGIKDIRVEAGATLNLTCTDYDPARLANAASTVNDLGSNFFADPLFCDPIPCGSARGVAGDYGLADGSPCLAANSPCGLLVGALGQACVGTAVTPETWAGIKAKYRE